MPKPKIKSTVVNPLSILGDSLSSGGASSSLKSPDDTFVSNIATPIQMQSRFTKTPIMVKYQDKLTKIYLDGLKTSGISAYQEGSVDKNINETTMTYDPVNKNINLNLLGDPSYQNYR